MISFECTRQEHNLIIAIVARAKKEFAYFASEPPYDPALEMDISATHANGNPLRLAELLAAPQADFAHDIFGIRRHIDRETGRLTDCFQPRFTDYQRLNRSNRRGTQ